MFMHNKKRQEKHMQRDEETKETKETIKSETNEDLPVDANDNETKIKKRSRSQTIDATVTVGSSLDALNVIGLKSVHGGSEMKGLNGEPCEYPQIHVSGVQTVSANGRDFDEVKLDTEKLTSLSKHKRKHKSYEHLNKQEALYEELTQKLTDLKVWLADSDEYKVILLYK